MKQKGLTLGVVILQIIGLMGWSTFAFGDTSWGIKTYTGRLSEDITQLTVAGNNVEVYGYIHVYQYLLLHDQTLVVLGRKDHNIPVLSAISLPDHTETVIATYSSIVVKYFHTATLLAFSLDKVPSPSLFILLQYIEDESGRNMEESRTFLELFCAQEGQYTLLRKEQLTETHMMYEGLDDLQPRYTALQLAEGPEQYPAKKDLMRYFFSDVNEDGYADILIWKQEYQALPIDDPRTVNGMFFLANETLNVMYFEAGERTFSSIMGLDQSRVKSLRQIIHQ